MARTPSDKLHRLVRSLSTTERRYFNMFLRSRHDRDAKYLLLFEALSQMEVFDEEMLKKTVYGAETVEGKKHIELKAYLYDLILKSLQSFDEAGSVEARLAQFLQGVAVLFKRGHYEACREQLQKARRLAQTYEHFATLIEVVRWEKQIAYTRMDVDFLHLNIEKLEFEERDALAKLDNIAAYRNVFFQVYTITKREAQQRDSDRLAQLRGLLHHTLFSTPEQAICHRSRILYYRTLNIYHYAAVEPEAFYRSGQMLVQVMEAQPLLLRELLPDYIAALSNAIVSCGMLQKYREVREYLEKMREISPNTVDDRMKIHRQYYSNLFSLCTYTGEFEEARRELKRCQQEADELDIHGYETASFFYQYCLISFGCADYDAALDYLNTWLSAPKSVGREDLQGLARILLLVIHYELDNTILLDSLLRSATRFLKKKDRLYELERRFMGRLHEVLRCATAQERKEVFQKLQQDIEGKPATKVVAQLFDLEAWVEGKITGRPFADIIRAKWA